MNRIDNVLIRPLLTEKTANQQVDSNQYAFEVGLQATKIEIQQAVQQLFGVKVSSVRTLVVRGKVKRFGRHFGKRSNWKKALVTLNEGETLNVYGGV